MTPQLSEQERVLRRQKREARIAASKRRQRISRWLVGSAGAASFVATLLAVHFTGLLELPPVPPASPAVAVARPNPARPLVADPDRPIFRYSIVPGGVRSASEVVLAMQRDPVVAAHYADVQPTLLRSEQLTEPMSVHVSYRIGDKVYWTKKKLTLNAGEKVLTDGTVTLRERCGNILSMDPLAPAMEGAEPAVPEFDIQVDPFVPTAGVELADAPLPPGFIVPPPPGAPPGGEVNALSAPTVVPEPSTWLLVATGLAGGIAMLRKKRSRQ